MFVQNEDLFRSILQVFASMESSSVVVSETENTRRFLSKMPLFAGFWSDDAQPFSRLIVGLVEKRRTNELIRRIETVTGELDDRTDVLLTVQETAYSAGALAM